MTLEQLIAVASFLIIFLLGVLGWFVRKLVTDLEKKVAEFASELNSLKGQFNNWKLTVEQNFVSFDTHETTRGEFRRNFEKLFEETSMHGTILARLDERSKSDDRLAKVLELLTEILRRKK